MIRVGSLSILIIARNIKSSQSKFAYFDLIKNSLGAADISALSKELLNCLLLRSLSGVNVVYRV